MTHITHVIVWGISQWVFGGAEVAPRPELSTVISVTAPSHLPGHAGQILCGTCQDLSVAQCEELQMDEQCHAWEYADEGRFDRGQDAHVGGGEHAYLGTQHCDDIHNSCSGIAALEVHAAEAIHGRDVVALGTLLAGIQQVAVEVNMGRSAIQILGSCTSDGAVSVVAHLPVDHSDLLTWRDILPALAQ